MELTWYFINTDGGSRGNPGEAAAGAVIRTSAGKVRELCGKYLGVATNNEAEYAAVILAYETLLRLKDFSPKTTALKFSLDSNLVVNQLNGLFKVKEARLRSYILKIRSLEAEFAQVLYNYIPREQNQEADKIVNQHLDARIKRTS